MKITFWGVRGSLPVPGSSTVKYGGNTPCLEINVSCDCVLIIDAGTGIMGLGNKLVKEYQGKSMTGHILISHTHWDHIQGFPFFAPVFQKGHNLKMYGMKQASISFGDLLGGQMRHQYFPVNLESLVSCPEFNELLPGEKIVLKNGKDKINVKTASLNHPGGGLAFRIECGGKTFSYICDTEQLNGELNNYLINFAENSDVMVHDSMYTPEELSTGNFNGWGHSSWKETMEIAESANVKRPVIFHHHPERTDNELDTILEKAKEINPDVIVAREGLTISV